MKDVTFKALCDGTQQKYVIVYPSTCANKSAPDALIALHGHGADRWEFIQDERDECRAVRDIAEKYGMLLVSPDYRATMSWMGPKAEADLVQIMAELKSTHAVHQFFLCGASMGGASCLTFACLHPDLLSGVASMNGTANHLEYANFQEAIAGSFGGSKLEVPVEYRKRSAEFYPEKLTMPVGLTVSGQDEAVPPDSVKRLARLLTELKKDVLLIDREDEGHQTRYADATTVLEFVIGKSKPA